MSGWSKKFLTRVCVCCVMGMGVIGSGWAAEDTARPVAVLSIASIDHLTGDLAYLTRAAGRTDVGVYLTLASGVFTESFDRERPAGVLITVDGDQWRGIGFLPVPNGDRLLEVLRNKLGAEVDDLGNGIKKLELGKESYLKQQGQWLYFTDDPRHLSHLPDDPVAALGGLDKEYGIALRFYAANVPRATRDVANFALQTKIDADLNAKQLTNPEIDAAFVESLRKTMKTWTTALINQSEQITIGWAVDSVERRTYVDFKATARKGSSLDSQFRSLMSSRSTFTGFFIDQAAASFQGALRVNEQGQQQLTTLLQFVRKRAIAGIEADPQAPEAVKEIATRVLDVVDRTVREGKTDVGATLLLAPESFRFVGGVRVADGRALADAFQQLFELARNEPDVPEIEFYADRYGDLDLHTLVLPVAPDDADARKLLGENVDITIATGPEQLYFALGKGADQLLKSIVDRSREIGQQEIAPVQLRIAIKPVMRFLGSMEPDNQQLQTLVETIEQAQGGDVIQLKVERIDQGVGCRLEIEEGVLELLGRASQMSRHQ